MNLKSFILLCTLLILTSSCASNVVRTSDNVLSDNSEVCTILGNVMLCTDPSIKAPPKGCSLLLDLKNTYKCPVSIFLGYQCVSPRVFVQAANAIDDLTLKSKLIIRNGL